MDLPPLPAGEQPVIERMSAGPVVADTFAGRIHVEWDNSATVTPLGQLPFFIEFVKQGSLFDSCVADCPLHYRSPNAPNKRDVLGTVLLSVFSCLARSRSRLRPSGFNPVTRVVIGSRYPTLSGSGRPLVVF